MARPKAKYPVIANYKRSDMLRDIERLPDYYMKYIFDDIN
jgi:hypothetical protein